MSVLMICGSPHDKGGNSTYFLEYLKDKLGGAVQSCNGVKAPRMAEAEFLKAVKNGENIVLSFPLYADSLPAYFLMFLQKVEKVASKMESKSKVYVIVNNGFYDAIQNHIAIDIVGKWCEKCGLTMGRVLAIGAGGMAQAAPIEKGPMAKLGGALDNLAEDIKNSHSGNTIVIQPAFPRFLYKLAGNMGFRAQLTENKKGHK